MNDPTGVIRAVLGTNPASPIAMLKPSQAAALVGCEITELDRYAKAYEIAGHARYRLIELVEALLDVPPPAQTPVRSKRLAPAVGEW